MILDVLKPVEAVRERFDHAAGLRLAESLTSAINVPDFRAATVDGYAVRSEDGIDPRRIVGEQTAGLPRNIPMATNEAVRIMTGAAVPDDADTIIMVEDTRETGDDTITVMRAMGAGDNIRRIGVDLTIGQTVLTEGTVLNPSELGLLATLGHIRPLVWRRPRIAVLSTGDEIVDPLDGGDLQPGQVRDSNRYSLMAAVTLAGGTPVDLGHAPDNEAEQRALFLRALRENDGLVTSGGVSVGKLDLVKMILEEIGTVHFGRVNMKPGKPVTFVTVPVGNGKTKPIFGLPGNPVSSLVAFELFVRPALRRMAGFPPAECLRPQVRARLAHSVEAARERIEFMRAHIVREERGDGYVYVAASTGAQNSSRLLSMIGANGLLRIEPRDGTYPAGAWVTALLLD